MCTFQPDELGRFLTEELQGADPDTVTPAAEIRTRRELAETILYHCKNGLGGEADITNTAVLSEIVSVKKAIGGTGVQASLALAAAGGEVLAHGDAFCQAVLRDLLPETDIVGMNEEELAKTLRMIGEEAGPEDILSVVRGVFSLIARFGVKKGVVIHTKDYSLYAGETLHQDIESGLMFGNMMACAKAVHGSFGTSEEIRKTLSLSLSEQGLAFRRTLRDSKYRDSTVLVPSRYIERPKYTIGLGDAFTAGVQLCF